MSVSGDRSTKDLEQQLHPEGSDVLSVCALLPRSSFPSCCLTQRSEMLGNLPFHVLRPSTVRGAELRAAGMREGWKLQEECVCCNEKQTRRSPLPPLLRTGLDSPAGNATMNI